MEPVRGTQLLERALKIIDILSEFPKGLNLSEISQKSSIPISTVHRILHFLIQNEYIRNMEPNGLYGLGSHFSLLSSIFIRSFDFIKEIRPALEKLNKEFDETVHLGVLNNFKNMVVYVDKLESSRTVRMFSMVGQTVPIHCTALGKSLIASLPNSTIEKVLENYTFNVFTGTTISNKKDFLIEMEEIRKKGFAKDNCEHEDTVICHGKAFSNKQGNVIGAISVSIPLHRYSDSDSSKLVSSLNSAISWIESKLL